MEETDFKELFNSVFITAGDMFTQQKEEVKAKLKLHEEQMAKEYESNMMKIDKKQENDVIKGINEMKDKGWVGFNFKISDRLETKLTEAGFKVRMFSYDEYKTKNKIDCTVIYFSHSFLIFDEEFESLLTRNKGHRLTKYMGMFFKQMHHPHEYIFK